MQCRGTGEIHTECGLAHGRSACHDDHLAGLQALRHVVDVAEARRHASGHFAALQTVELVKRIGDDGADRRVVLPHFAGGHLIYFGLRQVDDVFGLRAFCGVAELCDFGAGRDHITQDGALMHDVGVIRGVCGGRNRCDQAVQIVGATHFFQIAFGEQLVGHQHGVDRLGGREQFDDRFVHGLVAWLVEVGHVDHLRYFADGVLAHQHAAQHRHFGGVVMRRHAVEQGVAHGLAGSAVHAVRTVSSVRKSAVLRRTVVPRVVLRHVPPTAAVNRMCSIPRKTIIRACRHDRCCIEIMDESPHPPNDTREWLWCG